MKAAPSGEEGCKHESSTKWWRRGKMKVTPKSEEGVKLKEILIFAGTTEGRELSECLAASGIAHRICVATEYGELVLKEHPLAKVHCGRMSLEEMREYIGNGGFAAVVDATHPYAEVVTANIKEAMKSFDIPYLRLDRKLQGNSDYDKIVYFESHEACEQALKAVEGNILLTTGSKDLAVYCSDEAVRSRLYVRVLPGVESLMLCAKENIQGKQILALQGPFTTEMNEAMIHSYQIRCLVTKESGRPGGYQEKLEAAKKQGILVFVVGQPKKQEGYSFKEVCHRLEDICGEKIEQTGKLEITLAGAGMGSKDCLTGAVREVIETADVLLGAERMIAAYQPRLYKKPFYLAEDIIPYLRALQENELSGGGKVGILFSGDSGFYSGSRSLYQALQKEVAEHRLAAEIRILPGISSVAYFAASIKESYQDAAIYSMHGKKLLNLTEKIRREKKLFLLMSGVRDVNRLGKLLVDAGLFSCEIVVGYQLSYPEQRIEKLTPKDCLKLSEEGLYICCIKNSEVEQKRAVHGRADTEFIRDEVPMTKEEVRDVSICKLKLHREAVVYDIGSGTGSIAVEIAGISDTIQVFAIEAKEKAATLIAKNKEKFRLDNIEIVQGEAPEEFLSLPAPTHAFIGGSRGKMKDILKALYEKNPAMRVVINAVSMETICEIKEVLTQFPIEEEDIVHLQISRTKQVGGYHMMQAENPVWICSFCFRG